MFKELRIGQNKKNIFVVLQTVLTVIFVLFSLILMILGTISLRKGKMLKIFGYSFSVVLTPSMEPTIKVNDIIIIKDISFNELEERDIIVYYNNIENINVVHRIKYFNEDGSITTKGDNNPVEDAIHTTEANYIGKVVKHTKCLGFGTVVADYKNIVFVIIIIILSYIIISELINIVKTLKEKQELELKKKNLEIEKQKLREELLKEIEEEKLQKNKQNSGDYNEK